MSHLPILPLDRCIDPSMVGGKAYGLARLLAAGLSVPPGCCVTTTIYHQALDRIGFLPSARWEEARRLTGERRRRFLTECRAVILAAEVSKLAESCVEELRMICKGREPRWAVRSSATNEDVAHASCAGLYRTELAIRTSDIDRAIKCVWASIWDEPVVDLLTKSTMGAEAPAMAVVLQPMCEALVSGVAYSIHPVTGRDNQVAINAVSGLGVPLVEGTVTPDQFIVHLRKQAEPCRVRRAVVAQQTQQLVMGSEGLASIPVRLDKERQPVLSDTQLYEVARVAKQIEGFFGRPMDVEWAIDQERLWVLQARPITTAHPSSDLTNDECEWSRANFKETMPEVPSPMGLSFLERFMDSYILSHYRRLGCRIPPGLSAVRTLYGRPYLNVTLFYSLVGQLRGDPSLNVEQMGGEPLLDPPQVEPLGWNAYLRSAWLMWKEMKRVEQSGPCHFDEMRQLAATYDRQYVESLSYEDLGSHLDDLRHWLDNREVTFGIAAGVGQCLQTFSLLLPRWLGEDWRNLLNAALQGQGTVISAQQIVRLAELVAVAKENPIVVRELQRSDEERGSILQRTTGTRFGDVFQRYMEEYGHRALAESDIMSPRFSDEPGRLLAIIVSQLREPAATPSEITLRQKRRRDEALATIKARLKWRIDRWLIFRMRYRRLCRFFALREANRHHLMYYSAAARNLLLALGQRLVERGVCTTVEDIFFLTLQERDALASEPRPDVKPLIEARRAERARWSHLRVTDTIHDWVAAQNVTPDHGQGSSQRPLHGIPISPGQVTGPVRPIRSPADWRHVKRGDILLVPVIDPGMAPLFGVAAGLVVEMGGTLSHGAIIVREYGLPAVINVSGVTAALAEGELITLDADRGIITRHP